jgi:hypothetical protein
MPMPITITTDGTKAGTTVMAGGQELMNLESFYFSMDKYDSHPYISYSVGEEDKENHTSITTYYRFDPSIASMKQVEKDGTDIVDGSDFAKM